MRRRRRIKIIRNRIIAVLILFVLFFFGSAFIKFLNNRAVDAINNGSSVQTSEDLSSVVVIKEKRVSFLAVGDNLMHMPVVDDCKKVINGKDVYDFTNLYKRMSGIIKKADIAFINQETPIGGEDLGISGYPGFNSPYELADGLIGAGFDIINHASNHIWDKGYKGAVNTINLWKSKSNITVTGINETVNSNRVKFVEKNGIKIAFLAYTYGNNRNENFEKYSYMVNIFNIDKVTEDMDYAKKNADFVIVSMHWGTEYVYIPNDHQKDWAKTLSNLGADVIIGHHPHVLQPVEWIESDSGKETLVYYSLGNFVSSQEAAPRMLGGMAEFDIVKDENNKVYIENEEITPLITHYDKDKANFDEYLLKDYTEELASSHGVLQFDKTFSLTEIKRLAKEILGSWYNG